MEAILTKGGLPLKLPEHQLSLEEEGILTEAILTQEGLQLQLKLLRQLLLRKAVTDMSMDTIIHKKLI